MSTPKAPLGWTKAILVPPAPLLGSSSMSFDAVALEFRKRPLQVLDLESDVVKTLAAFGQELTDGRVRARRLDELDASTLRP